MQKVLSALIIAALFIDASPATGGNVQASLGLGLGIGISDSRVGFSLEPLLPALQGEVGYTPSNLWEIGASGIWRRTTEDFEGLGFGCPPTANACPDVLVEGKSRTVRNWYSASVFGRYYLGRGKSRGFVTVSGGIARKTQRSSVTLKASGESWVENESDGGFEARAGIGYDLRLGQVFFLRGHFSYAVIPPMHFWPLRASAGLGLGIRI